MPKLPPALQKHAKDGTMALLFGYLAYTYATKAEVERALAKAEQALRAARAGCVIAAKGDMYTMLGCRIAAGEPVDEVMLSAPAAASEPVK